VLLVGVLLVGVLLVGVLLVELGLVERPPLTLTSRVMAFGSSTTSASTTSLVVGGGRRRTRGPEPLPDAGGLLLLRAWYIASEIAWKRGLQRLGLGVDRRRVVLLE